ncbi:SH3 domain-binding protein 5-like [Carassius auratus]|uniref:SH3 domain-binding protein 5 n=1 Tax=Carassius auratus TaxID=7957 RepID=A0A6P6RJP6_CARAU|nr:SH3 domain-binding protein 5-like [Carassius auratus]
MNDTEKDNKSDEDSESLEAEEVDPRIQGELEKLNQSTDNINRWETELEDSRQKFRAILAEATVKLEEQVKKIGKAVEESKPYWEARRAARQVSFNPRPCSVCS